MNTDYLDYDLPDYMKLKLWAVDTFHNNGESVASYYLTDDIDDMEPSDILCVVVDEERSEIKEMKLMQILQHKAKKRMVALVTKNDFGNSWRNSFEIIGQNYNYFWDYIGDGYYVIDKEE